MKSLACLRRLLARSAFAAILFFPAIGFSAPDRMIVVQAESGTLGSDFLTLTAGDVTYVTAATDFAGTAAPATASKVASYTITFPQPGTYNLYARLRVGPAGGSDDSFYYGTGFGAKPVNDGGAWTLVNNIVTVGYTAPTATVLGGGTAATNVWKWLKLTPNNFGEPSASFVVPAGALTQTFQFGTRENGFDLDQIAFALAGAEYVVADFSNTAPVINGGQLFVVAEGADNGTIVGAVAATDPDPGAVLKHWTITGGSGVGVFAINSATGVLTLTDGVALNSEVTPSYAVEITVDDNVSTSAPQVVTINVEKPEAILVSGPSAGLYGVGQALEFTVLLGRSMSVDTTGGVPRLPLTIGTDIRHALYASGSGGNQLVFNYTVQAGDNDGDGIVITSPIELNGGTIKNSSSEDVGLAFSAPDLTAVLVDTSAPAPPLIGAFTANALFGSAEPGSSVAVYLNGTLVGTSAANASGQWIRPINHWAFGTGTHEVAATAIASDSVGNTGPASAVFNLTIVVDPLAPIIIQAEAGALGSDFTTATIGGVTFIAPVTNALNPASAPQNAAKVASYSVTFPQAGVYNLYARVWVSDGGFNDDSFYYANGFGARSVADANAWIIVNGLASAGFADPVDYVTPTGTIWGGGGAGNRTWKWVRLSSSDWGEPSVQFTVNAGGLTQTFQIGSREDGLQIDQLAFGLEGVYFTVPNLSAGSAGTTATPPPPYDPPGPYFALGKPKFLGNFFSHASVFDRYWNQVTPGNAGKWGSVEGARNVMNWAELDATYQYAKARGFSFKLHTLIWGNQQPAWMETLSPAEQVAEIEEWFAAVAARYPDIDQIDVVNEPLHDPPNQAGNGGGNYIAALGGAGTTGWDWVLNAFRMARRHFPRAELLINDYSITNSTTLTQNYLALIQLLQAENLVDGIGLQQHAFETRGVPSALLSANTDLLATAGLPIYITEMDFDGQTDQVQLDEMVRLFPLFWEHPAVAGITLGGYRPPVWRQEQGAYLTWTNGVERPALQWLRDYVMASNPPLRPTLTAQPASVSISALQTVALTLRVNANPAPAIQWQQSNDGGVTWVDLTDGGIFSGTDTSTLTIASAPYLLNQLQFRAVATNASGNVTTEASTLTVSQLPATIALSDLHHFYDGTPRGATVVTTPAGIGVTVTYNGTSSLPLYPGTYTVEATFDDLNYSGAATAAVLEIEITALVRHAPSLNGGIDGSIQVLTAKNITLNGNAWISGDLLVPGAPALRLNGQPTIAGTSDGPGSASPDNRTITLNGNSVLRYLVRRIDPIALPDVAEPPLPTGTHSVSLNQPGQSAGDFTTLRHLTLNGHAGLVAVPPGTYGNFSANGGSGFVLGEPGTTEPVIYNLQNLTLNGGSRIEIVGPVILVLGGGLSVNGNVAFSAHPVAWLTLALASGGLTLNGDVVFTGHVIAPNGTVALNGGSTLRGTVKADRLIVNGNASLEQP